MRIEPIFGSQQEKESLKVNKRRKKIEGSFVREFLSYCQVLRKNRPTSLKKVIQVCKELYADYTLPLLKRWNDSFSFLKYNKGYEDLYYSFEFSLETRTIIIPWHILIYEALSTHGVYPQLSQTDDLREFLFYLNRAFQDLNLRLNANDIRILRGLTTQDFYSKPTRYPTLEQMAARCRCHPRTFSRRFDRLLNSYTFFTLFRLNSGRLGYETYVSISTKKAPKDISGYSLAQIPLNIPQFFTDNKNYYLLISQIPYQDNSVYYHLRHTQDPSLLQQMSRSYIGWNLSSLTPSIRDRWKTLPPILSAHDWTERIISGDNGITYDLTPELIPPKLTPLEVKILNWYVERGTLQDTYLARSLGVEPKYINETVSYLLKRQLIHRFTIVDNIGLTLKPWITILGRPEYNISPEFIDNLVEHLKFFPFVYIFYDYGTTSEDSRPIVTGRVWLTPTWITAFSGKLSRLSECGFEIHTSYAHDQVVRWNIRI
ncbi:MAG: hypothetical protein ACFFFH_19555 [Candidatus Thorarchaeota archaeon]